MSLARLSRSCLAAAVLLGACSSKPPDATASSQIQPDDPPSLINSADPPFHYPVGLYARKAQGNVTLRLFIDVNGRPVPDSTRIEESSGQEAFDSAAVAGAADLHFVPAKLHGDPIGMTILFPVYFRHPEAPALPGDSILKRRSPG